MRKTLTIREILLYGLLFGVVVAGIIYLLTLKEVPINADYYHQYTSEINDPSDLKIGVLEKDNIDKWDETETFLNSSIDGHTFEFVEVTYENYVSKIENKDVDFIIANPSMYVQLGIKHGVSHIATMKNISGGETLLSYGSVVFTKQGNSYDEYSDLKNKSFAAVNQESFGGWQMTLKELINNDIDPEKDFSSLVFVNDEYELVNGVLDGTYDAGTVRTGVIEEMISEGIINLRDIHVISESNSNFPLLLSTQLYPEWTFGKASHISSDLGNKVSATLLSIEDTSLAATESGISGWVVPLNDQDVHTLLKEIEFGSYENYSAVSFQNSLYHNRILFVIILCAIFMISSITIWLMNTRGELVKMTEKSQQMEKFAVEASEAKGEFLANMSHEIRTPMSAIVGLSTLMESTDLSNNQKEYNTKLKSSAVNLLGIINNILDYSKIEAKKMRLENTEFVMREVLQNVANTVTFKADEKDIEFVYQLQKNLPGKFYGDPLRLGQILINLVTNAIKFTDEGQVVLYIESDIIHNKYVLTFSIKDSGIGMTEDQIEKIRMPFTQADSSFTRRYGGTGLGLTISNNLIQLMGGKMEIYSKVDEGSTFKFTLPMEPLEDQDYIIVPEELEDLQVLIVEDNFSSLEITEEICESFGFITESILSPEEALEILEHKDFEADLILVDYLMPEMNGVEFINEVKKRGFLKDSKALLMATSFTKERISNDGYDIEKIDFLNKPVDQTELFEKVVSLFIENQHIEIEEPSVINVVKPGTEIILAEDNKINQQIIKELLSREGFHVTIANDGQEVIELLEEQECEYEVILMDIQMPNLNGREATRVIRKSEKNYKDIPIVAMTANALEVERKKCLRAGMNDFLTKPIEMKKLLGVLTKYVEIISVGVDKENKTSVNIDFLESEEAITNMGGDKTLYLEVLFMFHKDYYGYQSSLTSVFKGEEKEHIVIEIHTIKGLAATIGAMKLHEKAKALETELKQGNFSEEHFDNFMTEFTEVLTNLENYFKSNPFQE